MTLTALTRRSPPPLWTDGRTPSQGYRVQEFASLPPGYRDQSCPMCDSGRITGAVVVQAASIPAIPGADDHDPSLLCVECGYWSDSFHPRHAFGVRCRTLHPRTAS